MPQSPQDDDKHRPLQIVCRFAAKHLRFSPARWGSGDTANPQHPLLHLKFLIAHF